MTAGQPVAALRGVTRRFRRGAELVTALDDVSLELYAGELTVAAGPSGSGKTTLLSIVAGFERVDAGQVSFHAPLPTDRPPAALSWRHVAFVPQALALIEELTARENIDIPARLDPAAAALATAAPGGEWSADQIMERLEIAHLAGRYPSLTSGGEQQRIAIGRAVRLRPPLLLGDEPTGHQDRERIDLVLDVLRQYAYADRAVLISSHDEAVIAAADRVVTLADGRIVADRRGAVPLR